MPATPTEDTISDLLSNMVVDAGGHVGDICIRTNASGSRSVVATAPIAEGDKLLAVPRALILASSSYEELRVQLLQGQLLALHQELAACNVGHRNAEIDSDLRRMQAAACAGSHSLLDNTCDSHVLLSNLTFAPNARLPGDGCLELVLPCLREALAGVGHDHLQLDARTTGRL